MTIRQLLNPWPLLFVVCASPCFAASADEAPWKTKPVEQWNQEDAKQVLADSPWAGRVQLQIVRDLSPDERRNSGNMEADMGKGVGLAGTGLFGPTRAAEAIARAHAKLDPGKVVVRWESARPVRAAELKSRDASAPATDSDFYTIVVYDIAAPNKWNLANELKGIAALKRDKKKDFKPSRVVISRKANGLADVSYLFRRSVEITKKDAYVVFAAQIGRLVLWQVFYPQQMQIQGELEL